MVVIEELRVDGGELLGEHEELLVREWHETDDGGEHVLILLAGEASLGQTAAQCLVRVDATAFVLDALGRATHDDA